MAGMNQGHKLNLRFLINVLVVGSLLLTLLICLVAGYYISKSAMTASTLEMNYMYASKLGDMTEEVLMSAKTMLSASALAFSQAIPDEEAMLRHMEAARKGMDVFASVVYVNSAEELLLVVPGAPGASSAQNMDVKLDSDAVRDAFIYKTATISRPYADDESRLIVLVTSPVYDRLGNYTGFLGGTIYLNENNMLQELLSQHFNDYSSEVYVVDNTGTIVYHTRTERIGRNMAGNAVVRQLMQGGSGQEVVDEEGTLYLAGYASVPETNWGIVAQKRANLLMQPSLKLIQNLMVIATPFLLLLLFVSWWFAGWLATPIRTLSRYASRISSGYWDEPAPVLPGHYVEIVELRRAMLHAVHFMRKRVDNLTSEAQTDPLTGLFNRRAMNTKIEQWFEDEEPFAIILIDIDDFKQINDSYGHQNGDEVLKHLSGLLRQVSRRGDLCCRFGGEEFVLLLPYADAQVAYVVAERLREKMRAVPSPIGKQITLSLGIAAYPASAKEMKALLEEADQALYAAKQGGKNRTVIAGKNETSLTG
ncbi:sensor domain-containing diguanylate cyclase [Paenibacillus sp. y28]|uniref:sensor domain-containing diguanylate cyclase n=1 Tax=Paenibacillus sp. y28 TaxID=3129110 RepID=UPI00301989D2